MHETALETHDLTKQYGDLTAVRNLNLSVEQGEVFGLLGPNGAGKTTAILMLLGLTEPTSGRVSVLGYDPARRPLSVKAHVGYLPEQIGFYDRLTARENLIYTAKLNGLRGNDGKQRIDSALAQVGLADAAGHRVATFSHGMRQRLGVADVLVKHPRLVILDEPTQGLDPEAARSFLGVIRRLKADGITILLSSHLLHQLQAVCDRVGLFHRGEMVLEGTVTELARRVLGGAYRIHLEAIGPDDLEAALARLPGVLCVRRSGSNTYELESDHDRRPEVARTVVEAGGDLLSLNIGTPGLDEVYAGYFQQEVEHGIAA